MYKPCVSAISISIQQSWQPKPTASAPDTLHNLAALSADWSTSTDVTECQITSQPSIKPSSGGRRPFFASLLHFRDVSHGRLEVDPDDRAARISLLIQSAYFDDVSVLPAVTDSGSRPPVQPRRRPFGRYGAGGHPGDLSPPPGLTQACHTTARPPGWGTGHPGTRRHQTFPR